MIYQPVLKAVLVSNESQEKLEWRLGNGPLSLRALSNASRKTMTFKMRTWQGPGGGAGPLANPS